MAFLEVREVGRVEFGFGEAHHAADEGLVCKVFLLVGRDVLEDIVGFVAVQLDGVGVGGSERLETPGMECGAVHVLWEASF